MRQGSYPKCVEVIPFPKHLQSQFSKYFKSSIFDWLAVFVIPVDEWNSDTIGRTVRCVIRSLCALIEKLLHSAARGQKLYSNVFVTIMLM